MTKMFDTKVAAVNILYRQCSYAVATKMSDTKLQL